MDTAWYAMLVGGRCWHVETRRGAQLPQAAGRLHRQLAARVRLPGAAAGGAAASTSAGHFMRCHRWRRLCVRPPRACSLLFAARDHARGGAGPVPASAQPACCHTQAAAGPCLNAHRLARWCINDARMSMTRGCAKPAARPACSIPRALASGRLAARQAPAGQAGARRGGAGAQ